MTDTCSETHSHVFLGAGHQKNERRTWIVIALCSFMMVAEIVGGLLFGSIALVADGLHMSTHAGALLLAALAYTYARKLADDKRFTFGTGKLGDLVIVGLLLARFMGWLWMDPVAGLAGSLVIASWSCGLIRDTGAILLDMNPDRGLTERVRSAIEAGGDRLTDLHLWRLGPGHLGAILCVSTAKHRSPEHYRRLLGQYAALSHVTVEVQQG